MRKLDSKILLLVVLGVWAASVMMATVWLSEVDHTHGVKHSASRTQSKAESLARATAALNRLNTESVPLKVTLQPDFKEAVDSSPLKVGHEEIRISAEEENVDEFLFESKEVFAVLILACNRPQYLERTLHSMSQVWDKKSKVLVSLDQNPKCAAGTKQLEEIIARYSVKIPISSIRNSGGNFVPTALPPQLVASHYKNAIKSVFSSYEDITGIIICEDDMEFSPDFFDYFRTAVPIMRADPSIWCVSSWNDLGSIDYARDNSRLFRSDFFPGLGWFLSRELWELELEEIWPDNHWDWFMRGDVVSKQRDCIVPEVSRNRNFGAFGATVDQAFFDKHISKAAFNTQHPVQFQNLSMLFSDSYEKELIRLVESSKLVNINEIYQTAGNLLIVYRVEEYRRIAESLGLIEHPRSIHKGLIIVRKQNSPDEWILLADARKCPYLPDHLKIRPQPSFQMIASREAESCHDACSTKHLRCSPDHFDFVNSCSKLSAHFPCKKGCFGGVVGEDLPAYASSAAKPEFYQYCLTTTEQSTCEALYFATSRLCPCIE
jgi:alpha-1,3-mannosyl-glycoprotein beta-1,2-N-acetylglucosaminyltransferase